MYELVTHCLHNKRSTTQKTLLQLGKQDSIWGSKAVIWDCRGNHKSIDTIPQDAAHTRENPRENKQGGAHNCLWSHASRRIVLLWYYFKWSVTVVEYNIWRFFCLLFSSFIFRKRDAMSIGFGCLTFVTWKLSQIWIFFYISGPDHLLQLYVIYNEHYQIV